MRGTVRIGLTVVALGLGMMLGGRVAWQFTPSTPVDSAQAAARLAFPNAGAIRDAQAVPRISDDPRFQDCMCLLGTDGYSYRGLEFPLASGPGATGHADLMAQARDRLEAAGWRTWDVGSYGDFAATRDGMGLTARHEDSRRSTIEVGATNEFVLPAALMSGVLVAVAAWLLLPLLFGRSRPAWIVAAVGTALLVPAALLTIIGTGVALAGRAGNPWPDPWAPLMLIGVRPLALLGALLLVAAVVTGLATRLRPARLTAAA